MSELTKASTADVNHGATSAPHIPREQELPGFWEHFALHETNGTHPGTRSTPADPIHAKLWAHQLGLDDQPVAPYQGPRVGTGLTKDAMGGDAIEAIGDVAFSTGDFLLDHGGQLALDIAGFVPVVNKYTEGAQAAYHGLHAAYDQYEGNHSGAIEELGEAGWHTAMMGVNVSMGAHPHMGGAAHALAGAEHVAEGFNGLHAAHSLVDAAELTWDSGATLVQQLSGSREKLPFLGGIVPWAANGAEEKTEE